MTVYVVCVRERELVSDILKLIAIARAIKDITVVGVARTIISKGALREFELD
jgi:hypothetical protein